jgi:hypothetical protein
MRGNLQLLHLADSDPDAAVARNRNEIKNCFSFTIRDDRVGEEEKRSHASDLRICNTIADGLRAEGFDASKAGPGKPRGAAFTVKISGFKVIVLLSARHLGRSFKCDALTFTHTPLLRRISSRAIADEWTRTRNAMDKVVRERLQADSIDWLSEDQLADRQTLR